MRMIDANILIEEIKSLEVTMGGQSLIHKSGKDSIINLIEQQPTIDAEPVVHAHWEELESHPFILKCSHCGFWDGKKFIETHHKIRCPKCDAKMDEK